MQMNNNQQYNQIPQYNQNFLVNGVPLQQQPQQLLIQQPQQASQMYHYVQVINEWNFARVTGILLSFTTAIICLISFGIQVDVSPFLYIAFSGINIGYFCKGFQGRVKTGQPFIIVAIIEFVIVMINLIVYFFFMDGARYISQLSMVDLIYTACIIMLLVQSILIIIAVKIDVSTSLAINQIPQQSQFQGNNYINGYVPVPDQNIQFSNGNQIGFQPQQL
eukprot:403341670